jgi:NADH:ubiquinone oxidoreductase subunit E
MIISICVGSSCHLKGSREIISKLEALINEYDLKNIIELNGSFCLGDCVNGVCVKIEASLYSVHPETTEEFFQTQVLRRLTL